MNEKTMETITVEKRAAHIICLLYTSDAADD